MMKTFALLLAVPACAMAAPVPAQTTEEAFLVWPPPQSISAAGVPKVLDPAFGITSTHESDILATSIGRYSALAAGAVAAGQADSHSSTDTLTELRVSIIGKPTEALNLETLYNYTLEIKADSSVATATASSVFGAMYALESFTQLLDERSGALVHSSVLIQDEPDYAWRGLMIDSGRRFFPRITYARTATSCGASALGPPPIRRCNAKN